MLVYEQIISLYIYCGRCSAQNSTENVILVKRVFVSLQVVQEYERAVIFRLGRVLPGGAKGPGMSLLDYYFII